MKISFENFMQECVQDPAWGMGFFFINFDHFLKYSFQPEYCKMVGQIICIPEQGIQIIKEILGNIDFPNIPESAIKNKILQNIS